MMWIRRVIFLVALLPLAMCDVEGDKNATDMHSEAAPQQEITVESKEIEVEENQHKAHRHNETPAPQQTATDAKKNQGDNPKYKAGEHYDILAQQVRTTNPDKIEINEIFAYPCKHCYSFESALHPWVEQLPEDVDFQRTPAIWQPQMEPYARAYYAALLLNVLDQVHMPLFEAIHVQKKPIKDKQDFADIFAAKGVDEEKFLQVYSSFGTSSRVKQAAARVRSYGVRGTPEIIVNGKYRVSTGKAGGFSGMLRVADFLIHKERAGY